MLLFGELIVGINRSHTSRVGLNLYWHEDVVQDSKFLKKPLHKMFFHKTRTAQKHDKLGRFAVTRAICQSFR